MAPRCLRRKSTSQFRLIRSRQCFPTGAGDTFAGGLMGYLASQEKIDQAAMRRAMIFGSVMASFNVEEFGTERVQRLTNDEINQRFRQFKRFTHFEEIPFERAARAVQ